METYRTAIEKNKYEGGIPTNLEHELFQVENSVIISTKAEVKWLDVFDYLKKHLDKFRIGSQFIVACGSHGTSKGKLSKSDSTLYYEYEAMFENLNKDEVSKSIIKERKYNIGTVIGLFSEKDQDQNKNKYVLRQTDKSKLKREFNTLLENKEPIVLILASCWSYQSEFSKILRSYGLYATITVAEERAKITAGKVFYLDPQQKEFLKTVTNEPEKKDFICGGKACLCTYLHDTFINSYIT